ncbi:ribonuclease H-like domain-containing protein [Gamsiella multidivaricata]|uniref:ribonuclease H-like domain-containing protein n=1 Tax=Gamsiella multidivaricata TaxID=101098 RepID=UPI00222055F9|nr:ribonuclease H-like domain-containing protein [Gamsiella multidivaricata]KAG0366685.1 3'-5' exonuclease [Gamsiella multidivaricata]KAI7818022.1 ribonuclease H-like domain-containing protein [Gamsiella multidivaricata]
MTSNQPKKTALANGPDKKKPVKNASPHNKLKKSVKQTKATAVKVVMAANDNTVTSSTAAKVAPSSNWKNLLSTIKPAPRKSIPTANAPRKHSYAEMEENDMEDGKETGSLPGAKARKLDVSSEPKYDTAQLWFDDISNEDLEKVYGKNSKKHEYDPTDTGKHKIGKYVGIDCEMVGVGPEGIQSALARVSIVNYYGVTILDLYVRPMERVTDFRTEVSGITPKLLVNAVDFKDAQKQVADVLEDKVVVGHAVHNDFKALLLDHPQRLIRDTSRYQPFRALAKGKSPSLKKLALEILGIRIQDGSHSSVEDARIAILLYRKHKEAWDSSLALKAKRMVQKATKNKKKAIAQ